MQGPQGMYHDVVIKRSSYDGRVRIENVPPDEFLISREAKSIKDARFVCHRVKENFIRTPHNVP